MGRQDLKGKVGDRNQTTHGSQTCPCRTQEVPHHVLSRKQVDRARSPAPCPPHCVPARLMNGIEEKNHNTLSVGAEQAFHKSKFCS